MADSGFCRLEILRRLACHRESTASQDHALYAMEQGFDRIACAEAVEMDHANESK